MKTSFTLLFLLALNTGIAPATTLYGNTQHDQGDTLFYSSGAYSELGDQILLVGDSRNLTSATLQLFNGQSAGVFDATLRFYLVGSGVGVPVGSPFGAPVTLLDQSAPALSPFDLTFNLPGISVPDQFILTLAVTNVRGGADLGLDLFDPPQVGSSSSTFLITKDASGFARTFTPNNDANIYLELTGVPEPATGRLTAVLLLAALGWWTNKRRRC
jgi:hypothetical protein